MENVNQAITGICTFGKYPICTDLDNLDANFAVIGVPFDSNVAFIPGSRLAPRRIREASTQYGRGELGFYNYETDEQLLESPKIVDCGDVDILSGQHKYSFTRVESAVRKIIQKHAVPVVLGGDHSITIPYGFALSEIHEKVDIVQIGAHLDWTDHAGSFYESPGSAMRRLSEMDHIGHITQIGIRGMGSSCKKDFYDAMAYGTALISAKSIHKLEREKVLEKIPNAKKYCMVIDIDGFDISIAPGTSAPYPGGISFDEYVDIIIGLCQKGNVVGICLTEVNPQYDPSGITSRLAALVLINSIAQIIKYECVATLQEQSGAKANG
ncbi:MAG: agmatinase [Synergistaceae bacterium]|nr:agmatinase [Synergistaceae bacterium]